MTTEKELAVSHPGFWRTILPMSEAFVRRMNRSLERYVAPTHVSGEPSRRGLVNEAGFRVFAAAVANGVPSAELDQARIESAWAVGVQHVRTMRQYGRAPVDPTAGSGELEEALLIATRTELFFSRERFSTIAVEPTFPGCGWIDEARGDVLADRTLFEIKAGERHFRSVDVNQLLTYCALNFETKAMDVASVGLVNPRIGTFAVFELDALCDECAGASTADVLNEILQFISEPLGAYAP